MSKEEILQALRLLAMGRANHPLQDQLAAALERLLASSNDEPKRRGRPPKKDE